MRIPEELTYKQHTHFQDLNASVLVWMVKPPRSLQDLRELRPTGKTKMPGPGKTCCILLLACWLACFRMQRSCGDLGGIVFFRDRSEEREWRFCWHHQSWVLALVLVQSPVGRFLVQILFKSSRIQKPCVKTLKMCCSLMRKTTPFLVCGIVPESARIKHCKTVAKKNGGSPVKRKRQAPAARKIHVVPWLSKKWSQWMFSMSYTVHTYCYYTQIMRHLPQLVKSYNE